VILDEIVTGLPAVREILDKIVSEIAPGPKTPISGVHDPVIETPLSAWTLGRNRPDVVGILPQVKRPASFHLRMNIASYKNL
jgi:hypothetical protein